MNNCFLFILGKIKLVQYIYYLKIQAATLVKTLRYFLLFVLNNFRRHKMRMICFYI